jgi:hypothetical protein
VKFKTARQKQARAARGFALVISLSLMVLITVLAVGLLGLTSIELRKSTTSDARAAACANARLGLMLALGQLQKDLGSDRRITADASILRTSAPAQRNLVGVWDSWSPGLTSNPVQAVGSDFYDKEKTGRFRGWLVADPDPQRTRTRDLAGQAPANGGVKIFRTDSDGFDIEAPRVPTGEGAYSWAVSQEATRAKVSVGGPESGRRNPNDDLQAQARPSLALSQGLKQPTGEWDFRAARILSTSQAGLDKDLSDSGIPATTWQNYTPHSMGLLTDVVKGGLKVDMNLGFEMSDSNFAKDTLATGYPNPFRAAAADFASSVPSSYKGQRPLYRPNTTTATHTARLDQFDAAKVLFDYPGAGVPTFNTLRSFYRIPHHLYKSQGDLTVFERPSDHVAFKTTSVPGGLFRTPWNTPPATNTQSSIRPIVDRVMFLLSAGLTANSEPSLVITPVITLWNPYNVALEIEGAVAYPWLDVPFNLSFNVYNSGGTQTRNHATGMAGLLGRQLKSMSGHGRSVDPYLYAAITANGSRITGNATPIRFEPGEIRVFTSASTARKRFEPVDYSSPSSQVSITGITTYLRPVASLSDFSTRGGFEVRLSETKMVSGESADMKFDIASGEDYPCFISVEDATRAKGSGATTGTRGQALADVLQRNFGQSGEFGKGSSDRSTGFRSTKQTFAALQSEPAPFAALEFYHRYAKTGQDQSGDLVYTGNPRQPWMSQYMTNATFPSGPQYKLRVRGPLTSFNSLLEVESGSGGRRAFYGPSNTAQSGKSRLSFFEVPRAPLLSMAAFQHADLSSTPFGPANQFANSWASAYVPRNRAMVAQSGSGETARPPVYDSVYLTNEALWDSFFFSGATPVLNQSSASGTPNVWANPTGTTTSLADVVKKFVEDPSANPLRNPRMRLVKGDQPDSDLVDDLLEPEGCMKIAGHLMVDGAFNINSTSVEAWTSFLSGLRGTAFTVINGSAPSSSATAFPRFHYPTGVENDHWNGFRTLTDAQVKTLAENIVKEVQDRGPFLSLGEFVNRRVTSADSGLKGALQAAIDNGGVNSSSLYDSLRVSFTEGSQSYGYPAQSRTNINPARTGVGIPGYLTQADVLQSIAPVITPRSDTFTIRGYGEAHDGSGKIIATAMCEAVVQRYPEFVDQTNDSYTTVANLNDVNAKFGRRFNIVSFRYLSAEEMRS